MRRFWMWILLLFGIGILCFTLALSGVIIAMVLPENAVKSDCIIVPGCKVTDTAPSLSLQSRLDCAFRLYQAGYAPTIIVSGGQGETGSISEAQAMRNTLVKNGVPFDAILIDESSYSTYENMINCKVIMDAHGMTSAIVATSDFHAARAVAIAQSAGIQSVTCGKARFVWPSKWFSILREVPGWGKHILNLMGIIEW